MPVDWNNRSCAIRRTQQARYRLAEQPLQCCLRMWIRKALEITSNPPIRLSLTQLAAGYGVVASAELLQGHMTLTKELLQACPWR